MNTAHIRHDLPVRSDAEALDAVCKALKLEVVEEILDGGSSARVYLAREADGQYLAVKTLLALEGVVDGHDLGSFLQKLTQIEQIKAQAHALGDHYLPILHSFTGENWAAYTTRYYPSHDQAAPLREPGGEAAFFEKYGAVVEELFVRGYGSQWSDAPVDFIDRVVIGRFLRRLPVLARALPDAVAADPIIINGRLCTAPGRLLPKLLEQSRQNLQAMSPARLGFCAHGDANTRNILMGKGTDFRLIDPRGSTDYWDPVYDLAKTLFCLTVWDPSFRLGFAIKRTGDAALPHYEVGFRQAIYPGYLAAIRGLIPYLASLPNLTAMFANDPGWQARLLLTHDMHVLAEAPCRLSDRKPKWGCDGAPSTPEELALGHYLFGTLLINELAGQLTESGELDAGRHLALIE